ALHEVHGRWPRDFLLSMPSSQGTFPHVDELLTRQGHFTGEALAYHRNGDPIWVSLAINIHPAPPAPPGELPAPGCAVLTFTDLTLTKLHEALQSRVLEAMVHEVPLPQLMTLVCQEVERMAPDVIASV